MKDGLYRVEFQTPLGAGTGVIVLDKGRLRGGDSLIAYTGSYTESSAEFTGEVKTMRHSNVPGMSSVFGKDQVTIQLTGTISGDSAQMNGTAAEAPGIGFKARITRIAD